jgi:hypothetical protein
MAQWWHDHGIWLTLICVAAGLIGLASMVILLIRMPADHFARTESTESRRSVWALIFRNTLGIVLLIAGILMSIPLVPGPGLLAIVLGLSLMNFPGKRRLETRLLRIPGVLSGINALRRHFGREPFDLVQRS